MLDAIRTAFPFEEAEDTCSSKVKGAPGSVDRRRSRACAIPSCCVTAEHDTQLSSPSRSGMPLSRGRKRSGPQDVFRGIDLTDIRAIGNVVTDSLNLGSSQSISNLSAI